MTHYDHSGAEQRCKRETPTQLDFALIIDEDVGTLEGKEGRANISNAKTSLNKLWQNMFPTFQHTYSLNVLIFIPSISILDEKPCTKTLLDLYIYLDVSVNFLLAMQVVQTLISRTHTHTLNFISGSALLKGRRQFIECANCKQSALAGTLPAASPYRCRRFAAQTGGRSL